MRQGQPQNRQRTRGRGSNNRSNNNPNRNQLNRSMESNGPDVRIRGTAAHIAEKYMQLAADAQTSGDTVAAQSYWQFAEHYNRLIASAQAAMQQAREEQDARREARGEPRSGGDDEGEETSDRGNREDGRNDARGEGKADRGHSRRTHERNPSDGDADTGSQEDDGAAKGEGPQPTINDIPAEVALSEKQIDRNGEDAPAKPRRAKRPRKEAAAKKTPDAAVTEEATTLPAFVTGE